MKEQKYFDFPFIKGMTFGFMARKGDFASHVTFRSFDIMAEDLSINAVVIPVVAWQQNAGTAAVDYKSDLTPGDWELENLIDYAQKKGFRVILKPMVNLLDGAWRASINFPDDDKLNKPSWSDWFKSYSAFILHMADIAQKTGVSIFSVGCELVKSESRDGDWRSLIENVRCVYDGYITYNTNRFREEKVTFWDAVDFISSSGYYGYDELEEQIDRIKQVVTKYKKPFAFIEAGCPSRKGSSECPYKWDSKEPVSTSEQARYYKKLFDVTRSLPWFYGYGLWEWPLNIYNKDQAKSDGGFCTYGKEAQDIIKLEYA